MEENKIEEKEIVKTSDKKLKIVILVLSILLICATAFIVLLLVNSNLSKNDKCVNDKNESSNVKEDVIDNKESSETKEEDNKKIVEVELGEEELNAVSLIPVINENLNNIPYFNVYQNEKVYSSNIDASILFANALDRRKIKSRECTYEEFQANGICDFSFLAKDLLSLVRQNYDYKNDTLPSKINGSGLLHCTLVGDYYACSISGGGFITGPITIYFEPIGYNNITINEKAYKDDKNLYIYQKYANVRNVNYDGKTTVMNKDNIPTNELIKFKLYKYGNTDDLLVDEIIDGNDYYEEGKNVKTFSEKLIEKYKDKFTSFKHTFGIREDGTYYYISAEEVKE